MEQHAPFSGETDELRRAEAPTDSGERVGAPVAGPLPGNLVRRLDKFSFPTQVFLPRDEMTFERAEAAYYSVGHVASAYPPGRIHRAVPSHIVQATARR